MKETEYKLLIPTMKGFSKGPFWISFFIVFINFSLLLFSLFLINSPHAFSSIVGILVLAFQMNHSYTIMHECCHSNLFRGKKTNRIFGFISAFLCLYPYEIKKFEHMLHHRCTGGFDEPVAKKAMNNFSLASPLVNKVMTICWKYWIPIFTANEIVMTWKSSLTSENNAWKKNTQLSALLYLLISLTTISFFVEISFTFKIIFAIYLYMIALEFFTMPHHVPSVIDKRKGLIPFHEQDKYTQSCTPWPAPLGLLLMLNFNYHVAHHLYPYVHFTNLKLAHNLLGEYEPEVLNTRSELNIMLEIRRCDFDIVFKKYYPTHIESIL